jgi:ABC-type uncharacterized transport system substrate-binding protein
MPASRGRRFSPLFGRAQARPSPVIREYQSPKLPTIGFLGANTAAEQIQLTNAFVRGLRELGWIEGRTVAIDYRWAEGRIDRSAQIIEEFVRRKVDVIVTHMPANVAVAKQATSTIPIVFSAARDPVGNGLVASLARPGGNVTGLSIQATDVAGKRVEILREAVVNLHRLSILAHCPSNLLEMVEVEAKARRLGLEAIKVEIRRAEQIGPAIEALKGRADALYVCPDPLFYTNRSRINALALSAGLPTMFGFRDYVVTGGLMSYAPNIPDLFRRAANFVDKILKGAKPSELPVEQPTRFDLVINLKTAKALGLAVPPTGLARADEVIE